MSEPTGEYQADSGQENLKDPIDTTDLHLEMAESAGELISGDIKTPQEKADEESPQDRAARLAGRVREVGFTGSDAEAVSSEQVGTNLDRIARGESEAPSYVTNSFLGGVEANLDRIDQEAQERRAGELEEKALNDQERQESEDRAREQKRHLELGHERYSYGGSSEELKAIRGERAKSELEAVPLTEMTPEMVESVKAAVEKGIAPIDMPDDLKLLAGVRIDDVGTFNVVSPEVYFDDVSPAESQRNEYLADFRRKVLPRVGTYDTNNGTLSYIDHMGRIFTAPSTSVLTGALRDAGYTPESGYVYCSNADVPADADRIVELTVAREVGNRLAVIEGLEQLGIDKKQEHGDLVETIRSTIKETPSGHLIDAWQKSLGMILDPSQRPAKTPVAQETSTTEYAGRA